MKKAKILAAMLSCTMLLSAAFAVQSSAAEPEAAPEYVDVVTNGDFSAGAEGWICEKDGGETPANPMTVETGKVVLTEDTDDWLHLTQTVTVKPETNYWLKVTCKLTAGNLRFDYYPAGAADPTQVNNATWYGEDTGKNYGTEYCFEQDVQNVKVTTAADQTEMKIALRNNNGQGKAVGEVYKIELIELDAEDNPVKVPAEEPGTGSEEPGTGPEEPGSEEPGTEEPGTDEQSAVAAGTIFPAENAAWKSVDDEGKEVAADKAVKIENGKAVFSQDTADWVHFVQPVTVKANTTYTLKITCKLTAGELRLDNVVPGEAEYPATWYKNGEFAYGTEQTFEIKIETGDRTELKIDLRNRSGEEKAIGEISKIELVEEGADGTADGNPETGVAFPLAALCVAAVSAGAVCISKKRNN